MENVQLKQSELAEYVLLAEINYRKSIYFF
ncbi:hypothetical protein J2736_002785 [Paenibacillus qinlingensis]|uniref:Uncharacterized protein n=1 Tax=Paenibacillus qinlingensis TaxID=1837343 RepID=A0ABU1NVU6_9BACL|nr:hypothetical protein [Paenibacillus qinlingensis]